MLIRSGNEFEKTTLQSGDCCIWSTETHTLSFRRGDTMLLGDEGDDVFRLELPPTEFSFFVYIAAALVGLSAVLQNEDDKDLVVYKFVKKEFKEKG